MKFQFQIFYFLVRIITIGLLLRNRKTAGLRIWPLTIFLFASLISDALGLTLCQNNIENTFVINIYTVFELLFITFYCLGLVELNRNVKLVFKIFSIAISAILLFEILYFKRNIYKEFISGYCIIFQSIVVFVCCLSMIGRSKPKNTSIPIELIVLFGLFIYSCLCILPTIAYTLYFDCNYKSTFAQFAYASVSIGNIIRDICFGWFGVILYRNNRNAINWEGEWASTNVQRTNALRANALRISSTILTKKFPRYLYGFFLPSLLLYCL